MLSDAVLQKLDGLPAHPGVYLFKDKKGGVLYVGKASSLRSRVRSYFQDAGNDRRAFIPFLQDTIGDIDTIVTANEKEATILENNLIKEHRPRYNVKLRDDKDFITLRLGSGTAGTASGQTEASGWPRLEVVRRPAPDRARYFGPYHSATAARRTLHLVNKHFLLRTCSDTEFASRARPCLQFQIKRCAAPCVLPVDATWYGAQVEAVAKFLDGRHDELTRELEVSMKEAARDMRFELAAAYRDQLRAIEQVREEQRVVTIDDLDRDVIGLYREGELVEIALLHVRRGRLADVATYSIKRAEVPDEEVIAAFLAQHYGSSLSKASDADEETAIALVPDEVILPMAPEGLEGIAEWLADRAGHKVSLLVPKRGHRVDLVSMATDNARHTFAEKQRRADDIDERLRDLQKRLRLSVVPRRIECCDISHLGGGDTVGAVVAMTDGELDKKRYRTFKVRGGLAPHGPDLNDDYGSMYEVLARRFRRAVASRAREAESLAEPLADDASNAAPPGAAEGDWDAPDLFVVDGGRGQLAVAQAAASDLGLHDLPIVALAKERETGSGELQVDRVYLPGQKNPIPLNSGTTSLFLLARLRDEAHRFSNLGRSRIGKKRRFHSPLDDVKGLGESVKKALQRQIGNLAAIRNADDATLLAVPGVQPRHVKALRSAFSNAASGDVSTVVSPVDAARVTSADPETERPSLPEEPVLPAPLPPAAPTADADRQRG